MTVVRIENLSRPDHPKCTQDHTLTGFEIPELGFILTDMLATPWGMCVCVRAWYQ